jgi:iron complex outermembrane receptor protein
MSESRFAPPGTRRGRPRGQQDQGDPHKNAGQALDVFSFNRPPSVAGDYSPLANNGEPWQAQADQHGGWKPGPAFAPDSLTNEELGWKTMWLDQRIQWDGAIY